MHALPVGLGPCVGSTDVLHLSLTEYKKNQALQYLLFVHVSLLQAYVALQVPSAGSYLFGALQRWL